MNLETNYNKPTLIDTLHENISKSPGKSVCIYWKHNNIYVVKKLDKIVDKSTIHLPEIYDDETEFFHIPEEDNPRVCLYICAPNQSGKTTYVARFIEFYKEIHPNIDIVLISKLEKDPILDKFKLKRIDPYKMKFPKNALDILKNSLVIFDDIDQIHDKEVSKKLQQLIEEILSNGAHFNIGIIITNHLLSDYKKTRAILNECGSITVFPKSGCAHHLNYLLRNYIGMEKDQIEKVKNLDSRWVTIFKNYPQVVLHTRGCYLL